MALRGGIFKFFLLLKNPELQNHPDGIWCI